MNISTSQQNFKIIEKAFNELNGRLNAANSINDLVVGILATMSGPFKTELKFALEQMLSNENDLPANFKDRALDLLSHVFESSPILTTKPVPGLRLIQGGLNESNDQPKKD